MVPRFFLYILEVIGSPLSESLALLRSSKNDSNSIDSWSYGNVRAFATTKQSHLLCTIGKYVTAILYMNNLDSGSLVQISQ